jgi:predicted Zn-dependent protease
MSLTKPRWRVLCALAVALAGSLPASVGHSAPTNSLPTLGDTARGDLSPIMERKLGEAVMHDIRRNVDYLDDDPIIEYLNNFGGALVAAAPGARGETNADYFFFAVRDPMLNAFALPGGFIGVHTALLIAAQTESELASVLSHEIGHVAQRHIARMIGQQKQDMLIPLAGMLLAALASKASGDAALGVMMGSQGLAVQRQLNFSRDAEREADRVGFQIMGAGGFDTTGMVAFFQRMQSANRMYHSDLVPASLLTHPLTSERIADIQSRIREMPQRQRVDTLEFHLVRARARVLQDETSKGRNETRMAFESQLTQQSRQQQAGAQYGLAFLALKRGDLAAAQSWLDKARTTMKPVQGAVFSTGQASSDGAAMFASMALEIKLAPGQPEHMLAQGLKDAKEAHDKFPLSRGIARQYADALIANKKLDEAARFLRDQAQQYRNEPKLHDLLAKTYAAQGKMALQHIALAESYALGGSLPAAIEQLNIARKAGDASFYDMAVIDARERELQARHREEMKDAKKNGG